MNKEIICSDARCKYCDDNYRCTKKKVELLYCNINTVLKGHQSFLKCKSFKERTDDWYINAKEFAKKCMEEKYGHKDSK